TDGKHRNLRGSAKLAEIFRLTVENYPPDSGGDGGAGHVRQCRSANRLEHDGIRTRAGGGLYNLQQLLALVDSVVIGVDDLRVNSKLARGFLGSLGLFELIVIVASGERNEE